MADKRVIVIGVDTYAGIFVEDAPDDIVIVLKEYSQGGLAIDGMNIDHPDVIKDLAEDGVELAHNVQVGTQGGQPVMGTEAFVRYLIVKGGMFRPGKPPCEMTAEEIADAEATFKGIASTV